MTRKSRWQDRDPRFGEESARYERPVPSREWLLKSLAEAREPLAFEALAQRLGVLGTEICDDVDVLGCARFPQERAGDGAGDGVGHVERLENARHLQRDAERIRDHGVASVAARDRIPPEDPDHRLAIEPERGESQSPLVLVRVGMARCDARERQ